MTVPATAAPPARSSQRSGNRPGQSQERARLRVMRCPAAARDAHPPSPEPRADFQPLRDFGLQSWAVGAGEAQFCRGDADFIVEVEQSAGMIRDVWIRTLLRDPPPDKQPSGPIGRLLLLVGSHAECPLWLGRVDRTVLSISARTAAR